MRIDEIKLIQFGPFGDVTIPLKPGSNPDLADVYLLTGPNGSGKSSALYAVAGIIGCGQGTLGVDHGAQRLRGPDSIAAVAFDGCRRALAWRTTGTESRGEIADPFGGPPMQRQAKAGPVLGYYRSAEDHPIHNYSNVAQSFRIDVPLSARNRFSWAAFAYAGMRSVHESVVTAIKEPDYSPFDQSLSFNNTANTDRLAQWVANQEFKQFKAKNAGKDIRAEQIKMSVAEIERIVGEIVGDSFAFVTSDEDINVRARFNRAEINLGLLPDGLKSIISWIADLLMRLDRIPWVDDLPTLQRPFLLLLDEVDVHLHPAWQRKVLPIVQRVFPKAQILASTHSPFVVASAADAQIITLAIKNGVSIVENIKPSQIGVSYSAVLRSIFGIETEFDEETEKTFALFHSVKERMLSGAEDDRGELDRLAENLAARSEEVRELVAIELRQLKRQMADRGQK